VNLTIGLVVREEVTYVSKKKTERRIKSIIYTCNCGNKYEHKTDRRKKIFTLIDRVYCIYDGYVMFMDGWKYE